MYSVFLYLSMVSLTWCGGELFTSESALKSSPLWNNEEPLLISLKGANFIPEFFLDFARSKLEEYGSTVKFVELQCPEEGDTCSLLSKHHLVVKLAGTDHQVVGHSFPVSDYQEEDQFLTDLLESLMGDLLAHIKDSSVLTSFLSEHSKALIVLISDSSTSNYSDFLMAHQSHTPDIPVAVVSSRSVMPLTKRPRQTSTAPTLHTWCVLDKVNWHQRPSFLPMRTFLVRLNYPDKMAFEDNLLSEFRRTGVSFALVFPPLPKFDMDEFLLKMSQRIYALFVLVSMDRKKHASIAEQFLESVTKKEGHIVAVPFGNEENAVGVDLLTTEPKEEAHHISVALLDIHKDTSSFVTTLQEGDFSSDDTGEAPVDISKPSISFVDIDSIDIAINHFETDLLLLFCKKGTQLCAEDLYSSLDRAYKATVFALPDYIIHFLLVECSSAEEIKKYKLGKLPSYVFYNRASKEMVPGAGDPRDHDELLHLVSSSTGRKELTSFDKVMPKKDNSVPEEFLSHFQSDLNSKDQDVYGHIANSLPFLTLPDDLVLTSENFEERIKNYKKTAVMFYMTWSVKSKVALYHLTEAHGRLEDTDSVALGGVACNAYTDLCTRYNITDYPTVLIFTPNTLGSPAYFPQSAGVIDSVRLQKLLNKKQVKKENTLLEISPATLPVIMKRSLKMPLVLWCDRSKPSSELGTVFTNVAMADNSGQVAYAWLDCNKYGGMLEEIINLPEGTGCPNIFGYQMTKHAVFQLDKASLQLAGDSFRETLLAFVENLKAGKLKPMKLLDGVNWPPVEQPITFPSSDRASEEDESMNEGLAGDFEREREALVDSKDRTKPAVLEQDANVEDGGAGHIHMHQVDEL